MKKVLDEKILEEANSWIKSNHKVVLVTVIKTGEKGVIEDVDAVVFALGAKGMKSVVSNSSVLARTAPEFSAAASVIDRKSVV